VFTGIVEQVGTVTAVTDHGAQARLTIHVPAFAGTFVHGESIAVNGVCLTVADFDGQSWQADVMKVTRQTSTLGSIQVGDSVNLERAMRADGRLGGHIMQGHVDAVATLVARDSHPDWDDFTFEVPEHLTRYTVAKGSISLNGVSLTIAHLEGTRVSVSLIPTTLAQTVFGAMAVGTPVNVEVDVIAKYVERMMADRA